MNSRWLLCGAVALAVFLALPGVAAAQADVITGRVLGPDGQPLGGARVEVLSIELETTRSGLTDRNGRYMILFPDGGGRYLLRISHLGMSEVVRTLVREDEELLLANVTMQSQAIALDTINVRAPRPQPGRGQTGEQTTNLTQDLLGRLPLADLDPNTVALLAAGVIGTGLDSITGRMNFSVAGMSELLNQITLDGIILGDGALGVPEEGVRQTNVTTNTFDVSRGGFAGGEVSMATARGANRAGGALSWRFDDDALQMSAGPATAGFSRHNLGGSWGGPLSRNRLFYNASFQFQRNVSHRFALTADDPLAAQRSGVSADSIARFLDILGGGYGLPLLGQTGAYNQRSGDLRLQGRLDWNAVQRQGQSHTVAARINLNINDQDSTRISALDLAHRGGEIERDSRLLGISVQSRLRTNWTHSLNASFGESWNDALPFTMMPEGRVRVSSDFEDGTRETRSLTFGGNRNMPVEAYARDVQVSNELSLLVPWGAHLHRLKVGGSLQRQRDVSRSTDNLFGSFTYASLADFEANRPARYDRTLTDRESRTGRLNAGLFLGDTWRISQPLEVTLGVRWDYTRLDQRPGYNPAIESAFGRRTDVVPQAAGISPRIGFSYRLSEPNTPLRSLTGGFGIFSGRAPTSVFSRAVQQTGLADAESRLFCIGDAVPIPDWELLMAGGMPGPDACADGTAGVPPAFASSAPNVTLIAPDQRLPASLRFDLGYRAQIRPAFTGQFRYVYSRGMGLWGYRDINLDESRSFTLAHDGRPFFGEPTAIVERTGAVSMATSRLHEEFGNVFEVVSDFGSETHQLSAGVMGLLSQRTTIIANYTLSRSRDDGGAGGGGMGMGMGMGGMGMGMGGGVPMPPTAGSPNERVWADASSDRRHTLNVTFTHALSPTFEIAALARTSSGSPFTPMVGGDINGDGLRNDRAFVFDPATAPEPAIAEAMQRLLDTSPARVRDCLIPQLGRIAERNSCRNGWSQSLDLRAGLRPSLPRLDRRVTVAIDARNVLTGLDQLFHGAADLRGWGEGSSANPTLLDVRGFDAARNAFVYEVNEGFGQNRRGAGASRNPFAFTISARVQLGGNPILANRGFGQGFGGVMAFGGMGGGGMAMGGGGGAMIMGGGGGGGGGMIMGGGGGMMGGGGGGVRIMGGEIVSIGGVDVRGAAADADAIVNAMLVNPVHAVMEMHAELALSDDQLRALRAVADTLDAQHSVRRQALAPIAASLAAVTQGIQRGQIPDRDAIQRIQSQLQPQAEGARRETMEAMRLVRHELSDAQWEMLPGELRDRAEPPRPQPMMGPGMRDAGGAQAGDFNGVAMLDRMLANPIPVLLELRETIGLSDDQFERVRAVSDQLQELLNRRRSELGRRFDGVAPQEQARIFAAMQPDIERARAEVTAALRRVQAILTAEQWQRVPERVRDPFQGG